MKKVRIALIILLVMATTGIGALVNLFNTEVKTIKSERQLLKIMEDEKLESDLAEKLKRGMVFKAEELYDFNFKPKKRTYYKGGDIVYDTVDAETSFPVLESASSIRADYSEGTYIKTSSKNYSKTNIQVENVDEADITKTDGNYIYSISDYHVIITDVKDPSNIKIASKINDNTNMIPVDIMLNNGRLVVIYSKAVSKNSSRYGSEQNTIVKTYDISSREKPRELKSFEVHQEYYTSRCIDNKLYVIFSGDLRYDKNSDEDAVDRTYIEDGESKQIPLKNIQYLQDNITKSQTIIVTEDLDDYYENVKISSFLMDVKNAYVSEKSIYLLYQDYEKFEIDNKEGFKTLFGLGGMYSFKEKYNSRTSRNTEYTYIYKFDIEKNGKVKYRAKAKVDGKTINQYSLDEKDGHLRIATYEYTKGAKITIFDEELKEIGHSRRVGENENMYSTRFMGDKAYVVTYQTVDPLFVIDLKDEKNPKVLGELSIPGYSMYLHPYDENHIIGIGMETKETTRKDSRGRVISTSARIVGMKMALFDVTDVRNPKQISQIVIGDSRTTSAILTNPKALLFSKEKELIAIPVNNYKDDFEVEASSNSYEAMSETYKTTTKSYISEGYCVYKINLEDGFEYKGSITHKNPEEGTKRYSSYSRKLLRGLYIDDNLYTISEDKIKVNKLENLEQVGELELAEKKSTEEPVDVTIIEDTIIE